MSEDQTYEDESKKIKLDDYIYSINTDENTASIIKVPSNQEAITIPRTIQYESIEYIITSISKSALYSTKVKSVQFTEDSEIKSFEDDSFSDSSIESIMIPSSLVELQKGWCYSTSKLTKITIDPKNPNFKITDDQLLLGRTSKNFDVIFFCPRNIESVKIPSYVKHIGPYAFANCSQLKKVEVPEDSELLTIECDAFSFSAIENFTIPRHLTKIAALGFFFMS